MVPSPNRRLPGPTMTGKTHRRNSSMRSCFNNVWIRFELPVTPISPPACSLRRATDFAASPRSRVEFCHSTLVSVREATYFRMLFSLDATGSFGSVTRGQWAAKISYVLRPSSSASDCSVCSMMSLPIISSQYFHRPTAVLEAAIAVFVRAARRLHDPVNGQKCADNKLPHLFLLRSFTKLVGS